MSSETKVDYIVRVLKQRIRAGVYDDAGGQLPTLRELCDEFLVSNGTAQAAVQQLRREGIVQTTRGSGARVVSKDGAEVREVADILEEYGERIRALEDRVERLERGEP